MDASLRRSFDEISLFADSLGLSTPYKTRQTRQMRPKLMIRQGRRMSGIAKNPTTNPTLNPTFAGQSGTR
jgi:hypothetical protein